MPSYFKLQRELGSAGTGVHPSELHGQLVGYLCAAGESSSPVQRRSLYSTWIDAEVSDELFSMMEEAFRHSLENLDEFADFEFSPLIAGDDAPIGERVSGLCSWCSGFLAGFGETGRDFTGEGTEDVSEALRDLARIAALSEEVPEGEDNEADLAEIIEYVRVSVLLVFASVEKKGAH